MGEVFLSLRRRKGSKEATGSTNRSRTSPRKMSYIDKRKRAPECAIPTWNVQGAGFYTEVTFNTSTLLHSPRLVAHLELNPVAAADKAADGAAHFTTLLLTRHHACPWLPNCVDAITTNRIQVLWNDCK